MAVRVGFSRSFEAGAAAKACAGPIRALGQASWGIAFCGGKHNPEAFLKALKAELGDIPIVGGSAAGAITRAGIGYGGLETAVAGFFDMEEPPFITVTKRLGEGEQMAGRELGEAVRSQAPDGRVVLLFYSSVAATAPLRLHPGSPLVTGFYEGLGNAKVTLIGAGTLTDMNLSNSWIFDGTGMTTHSAVAVVLPADLCAETAILHGCVPVSSFMQITKVHGAEVYELDGRPAVQVLEGMLGIDLGSCGAQELSLIATLGEKHGDRFAPYDENAYVNRLILNANPSTGSITLFEPDFSNGAIVQVMSRDNALMIESVRKGTEEILRRTAGRDGQVALYIDCAGRASARSGAPVEEADVMLQSFKSDMPLIGLYSGVEIAPVNAQSRPLDWTAVLTVLYRGG
ncbi:FIST N-terminal domain-containing protein [Rhodospirillaceae bacterium SYSU D60014]|uniref:FIST signal transduction protein n=1 Tax=Virgifigura deserti TaxID=2268457 RepID=UPI000E6658AE